MDDHQQTARAVREEITIRATAGEVWRALIDARELARWFPVAAEVEPIVGGRITFHWGDIYPSMSARILELEAERRLLVGDPATGGAAVTEYQIEIGRESTILRVIQNGFFGGGSWDEQYDGTRRGWQFQLRALRHYLEHHRGADRRVVWLIRHPGLSPRHAWEKLSAENGFALAGIADTREGDTFSLELRGGDPLEGRVLVHESPWQFGAVISNWGGALVRVSIDQHPKGVAVNVLASFHGEARMLAPATETRLQRILDSSI